MAAKSLGDTQISLGSGNRRVCKWTEGRWGQEHEWSDGVSEGESNERDSWKKDGTSGSGENLVLGTIPRIYKYGPSSDS